MSTQSFVPDPDWPSIAALATEKWGHPNKGQSSRDDIRFGTNGSKSVKPSANTWHDHEAGIGGGYRDLYKLTRGTYPENNGADHVTGFRIPANMASELGQPVQWWDYHGADECLIARVVRFEPPGAEKTYRQCRPDGDRWIWRTKDVEIPLYRLPALLAAPAGSTVYITEGEKHADLLHDWGLLATTNSGGAKKFLPRHAQTLVPFKCIILPDNDQAGADHASTVRRELEAAGCKSIRTIELPGLPPKGDVIDWAEAGHTAEDLHRLYRPTPTPQRILTGADFIARHVPPVWLIDSIVQRSRLYACTSLTGHGKTATWLFNACMIQAGRMIGQLEVFKGNALFLAGENPSDLEARLIGMAKAYNLPHDLLPYVLPGGFPLNEDEARALKRDIAGLGVPLALIVGDTASSFFPGDDENSNVQAGGYARTLRTFTEECAGKPAVVALCHPVKNASRHSLLPRGGGAFLNELDGNLALWSEALGEVTELHWQGKIRGPDFSALGYRLRSVATGLVDEKDRQEMTIIAEPMSEEAVVDHVKQTLANEDAVLLAIRDHPDWSLSQIARQVGWVGEDGNPEKWRVHRHVRSLAGDKLVEQLRGGRWKLTSKGEEALR